MSEKNVKVPYVQAYGNITKALEKIVSASTPDRFTQDFLKTKLGLAGGGATPLIPFLKRIGFLNADGSPTDLYKQFRNQASRGFAASRALRTGYSALYEINEYVHETDDDALKGIVIQATGLDGKSSVLRAIQGSFKALKDFSDFEADEELQHEEEAEPVKKKENSSNGKVSGGQIKLGYTINLNLPATSDIAVFNAIFKSLKEHLLEDD